MIIPIYSNNNNNNINSNNKKNNNKNGNCIIVSFTTQNNSESLWFLKVKNWVKNVSNLPQTQLSKQYLLIVVQ